MPTHTTTAKYGLDKRTFDFAEKTRAFIHSLVSKAIYAEDKKQLIRSSGSVGANFIEAKESISRKDFILRIKICKKEALETEFWLKLMKRGLDDQNHQEIDELISESNQLGRIFGSIIKKYEVY